MLGAFVPSLSRPVRIVMGTFRTRPARSLVSLSDDLHKAIQIGYLCFLLASHQRLPSNAPSLCRRLSGRTAMTNS